MDCIYIYLFCDDKPAYASTVLPRWAWQSSYSVPLITWSNFDHARSPFKHSNPSVCTVISKGPCPHMSTTALFRCLLNVNGWLLGDNQRWCHSQWIMCLHSACRRPTSLIYVSDTTAQSKSRRTLNPWLLSWSNPKHAVVHCGAGLFLNDKHITEWKRIKKMNFPDFVWRALVPWYYIRFILFLLQLFWLAKVM